MPFPRSLAGRLAVLALLLLATSCAVGLATDFSPGRRQLRRLLVVAPSLDREMARHLCLDSAAEWRRYCLRIGPRPMIDLYNGLQAAASRLTLPEFERHRPLIEPALLRVTTALDEHYGYGAPAYFVRRNALRPVRDAFALHQNMQRVVRTMGDSSLTVPERLRTLDTIIVACRALDDPAGVQSVHLEAAQLELELGRPDRFRARMEAALATARELGDHYVACQILGQLGSWHEQAGHADSMRACYEEGVALARAHRFPDQVARLMLFEASHEVRDGHLAQAASRMMEAQELVEAFGGRLGRVRLTLNQAQLLAALGCWDSVERTLRRMPVLLRESGAQFSTVDSLKTAFDVDVLQSRVAFARGDVAGGLRRLEPWVRTMPAWNRRVGLAQVHDVWSEGLMRSGRWRESGVIGARGLAHCDSAHVGEFAVPLALRLARALEAQGRLAEAKRAADVASRRVASLDAPGRDGWLCALRVLQARLLLRAGERERGLVLLAEAVAGHRHERPGLEQNDASGPGERTGLSARDAVHELAGLTPAEGYAFELEWRSLTRRVSPAWAGRFAAAARPPERPGAHLAYRFHAGRLLRWTAGPEGVRLDTLAVHPDDCLRDVRLALNLLRTESAPSGAWLGPEATRVLGRLARQLLPEGIAAAGGPPPRLEISPDGPLLALPFEALCLPGPDGPRPLAAAVDVSYQLGWAVHGGRARGRSVVVANPAMPPEMRRLYAWSGALTGSDRESESARRRWPDAVLLSGAEATKSRVMRLVAGASNVYVAAHHVRDPGAPFLGFIPLAGEPGPWSGNPMIESADVRTLDLEGCRLAVLASCASGAPYRVGEHPGPSLGDAFLDAGARAVVRSFWDVGDDETRAFMERFLAADAATGDPVTALSSARREAMRQGAGVPPRVWAAWSVATTRPAPPAPAPHRQLAASAR